MYYLKCSLTVEMVSEHFRIMTSIHCIGPVLLSPGHGALVMGWRVSIVGEGGWAWESYRGELKVVQAVVSQDEPASLPRLNAASCKHTHTCSLIYMPITNMYVYCTYISIDIVITCRYILKTKKYMQTRNTCTYMLIINKHMLMRNWYILTGNQFMLINANL